MLLSMLRTESEGDVGGLAQTRPRALQLMGHKDILTTMIYVQAITDAGLGMRSPLDRPEDRG